VLPAVRDRVPEEADRLVGDEFVAALDQAGDGCEVAADLDRGLLLFDAVDPRPVAALIAADVGGVGPTRVRAGSPVRTTPGGDPCRDIALPSTASPPAPRGDVRQEQDGSMPGEMSSTGSAGDRAGRRDSSPAVRASHADRDRVVDVLRVAAGDGLLTAEELDERLEAALSARTLGELAPLTADLPPVAVTGGVAGAEVKDLVRIEQVHSGAVTRAGRWVVPRRLELAVTFCDVTLDFTEAVITHDTLRVDVRMTGKTLTLVTRPGVVVDTDGLQLVHSKVTGRREPADSHVPLTLRVELVGLKTFGRVVVRPPRRTFGQWLLRRPASGRDGG
jgi:hypothetical protein